MSKHGDALGADLALLYQAGKQLLPHLADQFGNARSYLSPVATDTSVWSRTASLGLGATGCQSDFESMVNVIVGHLKKTEENLDETGAALCYAATDYANTDSAAKDAFNAQKDKDVLDD